MSPRRTAGAARRFLAKALRARRDWGTYGQLNTAPLSGAFGDFEEVRRDGVPLSLIFPNASLGYRTITVERPMRDEAGNVMLAAKGKGKGKPMPDPKLRDTEDVPLGEDVNEYFRREVLPHAPDAWIVHERTRVGYEIPFNRRFYVFKPLRGDRRGTEGGNNQHLENAGPN